MSSTKELPVSAIILIRLLLGVTVIFILITTRQLLVPLFFAVLLAYAIYPAAAKMEAIGIPRILTNLILIFSVILLVAAIIFGFVVLIASFSEDFPQIKDQLTENLEAFKQSAANLFGISESQLSEFTGGLEDAGQYINEFFTATTNTALIIGLIPVYTFLLLLYRNKFRVFISKVFVSKYEKIVQKIADQAATVVPKYMKGLFLVCLILVVINSAGFYIIGIKYFLLLGIIAAFFNLIPYLGTVIGYGLVFLFVLITQSPALALWVAAQFMVVQFFENNILTPNITGSYVQINPLVTIISLIAGGMIWGLPGMFMIIPYLAILKIFCENIPRLNSYSYLLGTRGTEKHLISWKDLKKKFGW